MFYDMTEEAAPLVNLKCSRCNFTIGIIHDHESLIKDDPDMPPHLPMLETLKAELAFV